MIIIAGLGNPGKKFQQTWHNIGFQVVDEFGKKNNFPEFKLSKKFNSLISEEVLNNKKIILVKPQIFMNESGKVVKSLTNFYKITGSDCIVIHDDIDLPLGKIRIIKNRGAAGHKGVKSIIKEVKTKNFIRFRIGVQPQKGKPKETEKFVLKEFKKAEKEITKKTIEKTAVALDLLLKEGIEKAMNEYNK